MQNCVQQLIYTITYIQTSTDKYPNTNINENIENTFKI